MEKSGVRRGVTPGRSIMLQQTALYPGLHQQHELDTIGYFLKDMKCVYGVVREVKVDLGRAKGRSGGGVNMIKILSKILMK